MNATNETETKHTPGPWHWALSDGPFEVLDKDGVKVVAEVNPTGAPDDEAEADARLIAAAPELLEACKGLVEANKHHDYTHEGCTTCAAVRAAKAAIAKATGISSVRVTLTRQELQSA